MASFRDLGNSLDRLADAVKRDVARGTKATALRGLKVAVENTPQDTGLAVSNWTVSFRSPDFSQRLLPYFPTKNAGLGSAANATPALRSGARKISSINESTFFSGGPAVIFIQNNVRYGSELDNGSSSQAPAGMTALAASAAKAEAARIRVRAR